MARKVNVEKGKQGFQKRTPVAPKPPTAGFGLEVEADFAKPENPTASDWLTQYARLQAARSAYSVETWTSE